MSHLIYSGTSRLKNLKKNGSFQLNLNKSKIEQFRDLKIGEKIFFYNPDTGKVYGYGTLRKKKEISEITEHTGSKGMVGSYLLGIDTDSLYERGFKTARKTFCSSSIEKISEVESEWFIEELIYINRKLSKILIAFIEDMYSPVSFKNNGVLSVLIYMPDQWPGVRKKKFKISTSFKEDLEDKINAIENCQRKGGYSRLLNYLMDVGSRVYEQIFSPLELDFLWRKGDFSIDFYIDVPEFFFPLEIAVREGIFLFKKNVISILGSTGLKDFKKMEYYRNLIKIEKVLLLASMLNDLKNPLNEARELYESFKTRMDDTRFEIHLIARSIDFELLRKNIRFADIIHFCGHTVNNEKNGIRDSTLFSALKDLPEKERPGMIFINSCGWGYKNGLEVTALGVECCITSRNRIPDYSGDGFIRDFYSFIKRGFTVSYSFNRVLNKEILEKRLIPISYSFFGNSRIRYEV